VGFWLLFLVQAQPHHPQEPAAAVQLLSVRCLMPTDRALTVAQVTLQLLLCRQLAPGQQQVRHLWVV
jgi:hypothetical protein